ncbi:uncharacterized protein LOC124169088 [Ischnura elegans]|uniref:uncharacterized protein LOC124169088 n=1 Tax=Ischnura elegans TaxID=197161 RepID=UPI001ED89822|nr:uncharacterized protein LOC124169088 [Ischnura elegans]XP_046403523.1 uncharacterized protein LOC124169088 [Ischnura elegans]XP_046403524.1 uncharacterized protein LOC124169088 [Ischnura elegans]XP_046403525.1 uncharacterized protein LOC124169088 [Ischnura elegans]
MAGLGCETDEWLLVDHEKIEFVLQELSKNWPSSVQMYNFIQSCMLWSTHYPHAETKVFYESRAGYGTIIASFKAEAYIVTVYSAALPNLSIANALKAGKVVNLNDGSVLLSCIPKEISPTIAKAMRDHNVAGPNTFNEYWLSADLAKSVNFQCPEDMYLSNLEPEHAATVVLHWPYAGANSLDVITQMINVFDTVGIFTKKDSKLVSWVLNTYYGIGMLHTIEEYRRKGYGSVIVKKLVKSLGDKGIHSYILTRPDNHAANSLFMNIGFKQLNQVDFMRVS